MCKFFIPESAPSGFKNVELGFVCDMERSPKFVTGVWEVGRCASCPGGGIDALERFVS